MTASAGLPSEMVDTNVLIYAYDPAEGDRFERASQLVTGLIRDRRLVLSVQVLKEFYAAATHPRRPDPLSHQAAVEALRTLSAASHVLPLTQTVTFLAVGAVPVHGLSFWDALIWAAAHENAVPTIYTEDFQHGREIEGVRFVNPFLG